jgi:hypothetical protein
MGRDVLAPQGGTVLCCPLDTLVEELGEANARHGPAVGADEELGDRGLPADG